MPRALTLTLALAVTTQVQAAGYLYLQGITMVTYRGVPETNTARCENDWKAWNTAIDFVAGQSVRLKLVRDDDYTDRVAARYDAIKTPNPGDPEAAWTKWNQEMESAKKFGSAPTLLFHVTSIDMVSGCAGMIDAEVFAPLETSKMIATGNPIVRPSMKLWWDQYWVTAPFASFTEVVIKNSEQILKKFVNDWTASQNSP